MISYAQRMAHQAALDQRRQYLIARGGFHPERVLSYWRDHLAEMRACGMEPIGPGGMFEPYDDNVSIRLRPEPRLLDPRKLARAAQHSKTGVKGNALS